MITAWLPYKRSEAEEWESLTELEKLVIDKPSVSFWGVNRGSFAELASGNLDKAFKALSEQLGKDLYNDDK